MTIQEHVRLVSEAIRLCREVLAIPEEQDAWDLFCEAEEALLDCEEVGIDTGQGLYPDRIATLEQGLKEGKL